MVGPVSSLLSQDTSLQSWPAYCLPQLQDPQCSQLRGEPLWRKEWAEKEQSLAHNPYPPLPGNFSIPQADSLSAQPKLPASSQSHYVCVVSNASPMQPPQLPLT